MPDNALPDGMKWLPCKTCNKPTAVSKYCSKAPRCEECRQAAMTDAIRQIASRSGPVYDKMMSRHKLRPGGWGRGREQVKDTLIPPDQVG